MEHCKILVPLDFSEGGEYALQAALKIAQLFDGSITPFHVYVPVTDMYGTDTFEMSSLTAPVPDIEEMEEIHREHLQEFAEAHIPKNLLTKPLVSVGNPAAGITETADEFDLIIINSHGRSGFSRFFMGSVSDKVLRTSHIPVLTVNKEKQLHGFDRIMIGTDFSEHSMEVFPLAMEIALKANSKVELVHILRFENYDKDEPDEATIAQRKDQLDNLASEKLAPIAHLLETKIIVSSKATHEAILEENLNNPHNLILMSTVGHTGIDYLMMGSTTSNVVRHVKSPVLSINPKKKAPNSEEK